jgi:leucyl-tRNA synthetase
MDNTYHHREIEKKWQKLWVTKKLFKAKESDRRPKHYILDMFPYPSGAGLHVGHPEGYTATDIISRYKRMKGFNVLHPMGWDAFGLPAENYAIKTKIHPEKSTLGNIKVFKRQIQELGFSYDWDREVATCLPDYYRWTQWFFSFLYREGLAYKKTALVNWCEGCQTVLANEQVINGQCDRCQHQVIQKELAQWFFKITDFLEDSKQRGTVTSGLLNGLETIDWPESTKMGQRNWIGKKEGVIVHHQVEGMKLNLDTFSAFPAWLFADTFMVIAPEHPLVHELVKGTPEEKSVKAFIAESRKISVEDRNADRFEKKGVFTGRYALDPFNEGAKMPIWLANFALMDFGTGIIRCSAHDTRDHEFAQKYGLQMKEVVDRTDPNLPVDAHTNAGVLKDSGPFNGRSIDPQLIEEMLDWIQKKALGRRNVTYRLRDWLVSRQRYWGAPIPIVYDDKGNEYLIPDNELPVLLPKDVNFMPKGKSPLTSSKKFHNARDLKRIEKKLKAKKLMPKERKLVRRESDTMDTFVCSSWYQFRFMDPKNKKVFADKKMLKKWGPIDLYVGGAEHTVLHLLYSRFFTKALHRYGYINYDEPFTKLRHQGIILGEDGEKMSKSRGNVINPDEIIKNYGADTLRLYEMFMGPFEQMKPWSSKGVHGVYRFLQKIWRLTTEAPQTKKTPDERTLKITHQTLKKVTHDIEEFKFNTAIAQMMIMVNHLQKQTAVPRKSLDILLICLYPFAPHMAEELWKSIKNKKKIMDQKWPKYDAKLAEEHIVNLPIQINGKLRAMIEVAIDIPQDEALQMAMQQAMVQKHIDGAELIKVIFIPGKILNLVVREK